MSANGSKITQRPLAVVTGASMGIGYELAREFAEHGYDLIIAAENQEIESAAQNLRRYGTQVEAVQVDLAKREGVESLYSKIQAGQRDVDALALNAGVGVGGSFIGNDLDAELNVIQLNAASPVHLAKRVLKDMVARGSGKVLFTSSIASTMPAPFLAVYAASKAFLQSFAQAIRNELKDTGVTITLLMPGATDTEFFERAGMQDTKVGIEEKDDPAVVAKQGFEALMAGKDAIAAGSMKNKLQATAAKILPETVKASIHRSETEPGSGLKKGKKEVA